ncbi:MAG: DNA repair protein RecN [Candidatus Thorarchaeota archaeon]
MLKNLIIHNIVLIDSLNIPMDRGFCVLTGETGSGKSILLDALGLAIGYRSSSRLLRYGEKQGTVVAEFSIQNNEYCKRILDEHGIMYNDNLVLRRLLSEDGKSKAFINDIPVGQTILNQVGDCLLEVHGQHEQRGLLNPAVHGKLLDEYGNLEQQVYDVNIAFDAWKNIVKDLEDIESKRASALQEEDYLRHISNEISSMKIEVGEEEFLAEKRSLLMNKEKIIEVINAVENKLSNENNTSHAIASAQSILMKNLSLSDNLTNGEENNLFEKIIEALEHSLAELNEAENLIGKVYKAIGHEDENLDSIEERLFTLRGLSRKFNVPVDELPVFLEEVNSKLSLLENQEITFGELKKNLEVAKSEYLKKAKNLSNLRKKIAREMEQGVEEELKPLKMNNVEFRVEIENLSENSWNRSGIDSIRFLASTNPGTPVSDISKIASGGELSRFMLALKVVLSKVKSVPTIIFDEIDSGIGGSVADAVGERLKKLGQNLQVIVVTHHPQVTAKGNYHLRVRKEQNMDVTNTFVDILENNERRKEVARMLSGEEITDEALAAADKLLKTTT